MNGFIQLLAKLPHHKIDDFMIKAPDNVIEHISTLIEKTPVPKHLKKMLEDVVNASSTAKKRGKLIHHNDMSGGDLWDWIKEKASDAWDGIKSVASTIGDWVKSGAEKVFDISKDLGHEAWNAGKDAVGELGKQALNMAKEEGTKFVTEGLKNLVTEAPEALVAV